MSFCYSLCIMARLFTLCTFILLAVSFLVFQLFKSEFPPRTPSEIALLPYLNPIQDATLLDDLCKEPYFYLGEGGQCYAFSSTDGNYVLKILKYKKLLPSKWVLALPDWMWLKDLKEDHLKRKHKKLHAVFMGHQLAFQFIPEESGLIYVQVKPTGKERVIELVGKEGDTHLLDLSQTVFFIQKKGELLSHFYKRSAEAGKLQEIFRMNEQIIALYRSELQKGVADRDFGITHNIGFSGENPLHLDVGKLIYSEGSKELVYQLDYLSHVSRKMVQWFEKNYPQYSHDVSTHLDSALEAALR